MEDQSYLDNKRNELNLKAQKTKDRFIDCMLRLFEDFKVDWGELMGGLSALAEEEKKIDKK